MSIAHLYRYLSVPSDNNIEAKESEQKIFLYKELPLKEVPRDRDKAYLNDPFDMIVNLSTTNNSEKVKAEGIQIAITHFFLALSEKRDDILMWSHYAEKHTGYCLEFDFKILQEWIGNGNLDKVEYHEDFVGCGDFINMYKTNCITDRKIRELFLLRKSDKWSHEKEWRILLTENDYKKRSMKFPEKMLTGVIFGYHTDKNEISRIKTMFDKWVDKPTFYQALADDNRYALNIRDETPPF